jgi:hypothetical protein
MKSIMLWVKETCKIWLRSHYINVARNGGRHIKCPPLGWYYILWLEVWYLFYHTSTSFLINIILTILTWDIDTIRLLHIAMGYLQQSTQTGRRGWYPPRIKFSRERMVVAIFNLSNEHEWTETYLGHIKLVYFVYLITSVPEIRHQNPWTVNPDSHAKHTQAQMHPVMTLSWLFHVIAATSRVLWRHGRWWRYVNSTVRTLAVLFSVATVDIIRRP